MTMTTEQTDPRVNDICVFPQSQHPDGPYGGMMLRDQFALAALPALITGRDWAHLHNADKPAAWAIAAYVVADAMLRERGK